MWSHCTYTLTVEVWVNLIGCRNTLILEVFSSGNEVLVCENE